MIANNKIFALSVGIFFLLTGCGGEKDASTGGEDSASNGTQNVEVKGIPSGYDVTGCIDNNGDYSCDTQEVPPDKLTVSSNVGDNALILTKLSPPADIGSGAYQAYNGVRTIATPAKSLSTSPLDALAHGLHLLAQTYQKPEDQSSGVTLRALGETNVSGLRIYFGKHPIHSHEDALNVLKNNFSLDGTKVQNEAILQALNMNLERLGEQGLGLGEALPANIKAMAESLVNLTVQSQSICERYPEYCAGNPDDTYPPIDLSSITPLPEATVTPADCVRYEYGNCVEWVGPMPSTVIFSNALQFSKNDAAEIASHARDKSGKTNTMDHAVTALQCNDNEIKNLYLYGLNDSFGTSNNEVTNPLGQAAVYASLLPSYGLAVSDYDFNATQHTQAALIETLSGIPTSINAGRVIIGLRENSLSLSDTPIFNSSVIFGSLQNNAWFGELGQTIINTWTSYGDDVYASPLSTTMSQGYGHNLLAQLQSGQQTDVMAGTLLNVDFIAIAACEDAPEPSGQPVADLLEEMKNGFECAANEQYMEIVGGDFDDFTGGADPHTAGAYLNSFAQIEYDTAIAKQHTFADSLDIAFPNSTVTHATFAINTRTSAPGAANDVIAFGDFTSGVPTNSPFVASVQPGGTATSNNGTLRIVNESQPFNDASQPGVSLNMLDMLNSGATDFDVIVGDQTEVDGTLLMLCLGQNCIDTDGDGYCDEEEKEVGSDPSNPHSTPDDLDGDGYPNNIDCNPTDPDVNIDCTVDVVYPESCNTEYTLALHEAGNWVFAGTNTPPNVGNAFTTYPPNPAWAGVIWDGDMDDDGVNFGPNDTWFNFGSAPNTTHVLQNDFCACGDVKVTIEDMKSDNEGYIDIINTDPQSGLMNRLVSRTAGHSQVTMASWGPVESGVWQASGNGSAVDYTLEFGVKNYSGPSGGAVQGSLAFVGHLGACTSMDEVDGGVDTTWPRPLVVDDIAISVGDIAIVEDNQGGGSVVFDVTDAICDAEDISTGTGWCGGGFSLPAKPSPILASVSAASGTVIPPETGLTPLVECVDGNLQAVWYDDATDEYYRSPLNLACDLSAWPPTAL
ncbi:hypothetical protein A1OS_22370 [Enterovibrio norvegicus]|uniref:thrombospondin type 3 repeat-containing protein n=1 Tax=Enterovibrio norvegicus TaxID=188144 RepID=UPI000318952A|nr:thrombospondin type 3 repeat-containing protein [Enterovibrio norvegicus]OEE52977.1 hypothetical protein A1OS_22370 [Enterovibrio norvegicus]